MEEMAYLNIKNGGNNSLKTLSQRHPEKMN